jgi:hypothetical protein
MNPNAVTPGSKAGAGTQTPTPVVVIPPTNKSEDPIPVVVTEPIPEPPAAPATNNVFGGLGGGTFGFSLPSYLQNTIPQTQPAPVTVIVNNNGTTLMQEDFVVAVADALVVANTQGRVVTRPGGTRSDEG